VVILWINTLLLGGLGSTREAGIFNAATRYVTAGLMAGVAVQQVMGPKLSELLAKRSMARAGAVYQTATTWLVTLTWPLYLTFALFSPTLLRVFDSGFSAGETSLIVLGLTMLVATGVGTVDVVLLMGGRSSWNLIDTAVALVVGVILNVLLIPPLGVTGAAIAWAASILTRNLASLAQVWIFMRLHPFGPGFKRAAVPALVLYGGLGLVMRLLLGTSIPFSWPIRPWPAPSTCWPWSGTAMSSSCPCCGRSCGDAGGNRCARPTPAADPAAGFFAGGLCTWAVHNPQGVVSEARSNPIDGASDPLIAGGLVQRQLVAGADTRFETDTPSRRTPRSSSALPSSSTA
jgi:Membrane protein involved in the export of O-antigen and teichoic acid